MTFSFFCFIYIFFPPCPYHNITQNCNQINTFCLLIRFIFYFSFSSILFILFFWFGNLKRCTPRNTRFPNHYTHRCLSTTPSIQLSFAVSLWFFFYKISFSTIVVFHLSLQFSINAHETISYTCAHIISHTLEKK